MDRQVIGILRPVLQHELQWANPNNIDVEYGYITSAFTVAYALGVLLFGWFIDKIGTKIGYAISVTIWGLSSLSHALARTSFGLGVARVVTCPPKVIQFFVGTMVGHQAITKFSCIGGSALWVSFDLFSERAIKNRILVLSLEPLY